MKRILRLVIAAIATSLLSSCLLLSPYHNQILETTGTRFTVSAWSFDHAAAIWIGCAPGSTGSQQYQLYLNDNLYHNPRGIPDSTGQLAYAAQQTVSLPERCWRQEADRYYTRLWIRDAVCETSVTPRPCVEYFTVDQSGRNCVYDSFGASHRWVSWLGDNCYRVNPGTNLAEVRQVTLIANRL